MAKIGKAARGSRARNRAIARWRKTRARAETARDIVNKRCSGINEDEPITLIPGYRAAWAVWDGMTVHDAVEFAGGWG